MAGLGQMADYHQGVDITERKAQIFAPESLIVRIWHQLCIDPETWCWVYVGSNTSHGYAYCFENGKRMRVCRVMYEQHVAPIPDDLQIDHLCRNRACCNPEHLEPVTPMQNVQRIPTYGKNHCPQGHPFTPENSYYPPGEPAGSIKRHCKQCKIEHTRRYRQNLQAR